MRQLDAELRRLSARRVVRGTLLVAVLVVLIAVTIATAKGHQSSSDGFIGCGSFQVTNSDGSVSTFTQPCGHDTRIDVGRSLPDALQGTGVTLLFAGIALGASFVGAEFNVGSLTTQLLFEPRRGRMHAAKAAAVAIGGAVFALVVLAVVALSMYAGSELRGIVHGAGGAFWLRRAGEALRIAAAVGAAATFGYCVTLVTRRSSAGMMAMLLQYPLLFLLDPAKMPWGVLSHYAPLRALLAVVIDPANANGVNERAIHTIAGGVVLTGVWAVVLLAYSGWSFGRAEVR